MLRVAINLLERTLNCKIYRNGLPRGADLSSDLQRAFGKGFIRTVFDVGANVGQSSLEYTRIFPDAEIHAFEPVKKTFDLLKQNLLQYPRVTCHHLALGDAIGRQKIACDGTSTTNSLVTSSGKSTEAIEVTTLDQFCQEHGVAHINLLKVDVEGFELEVLEGASQTLRAGKIDLIYLEAEPVESAKNFVPFNELVAKLKPFEFELFAIYDQQMSWSGRQSLIYFNPMFVSSRILRPAN